MRGGVAAAALLLACSREAEPRAQTLLHLDTNVFVPGQGDTLLIERLDATGSVIERRRHTAPNKSDWPVSFGILPGAGPARFRVRLFPESRIASRKRDDTAFVAPSGVPDAREGYERDAAYGVVDVGDPLPGFAIDRLIELAPATSGVEHVRVVLRGECMGVVADVANNRTCNDANDSGAIVVAASEGLEHSSAPFGDTRVGTWADAIDRPCSGEPRAESGVFDEDVCIPGGVFFLGDERMATARCSPLCETSPERVVRMSPFYLDRYEVSVGRFRAALKAGFKPTGAWGTGTYCNYRDSDAANALPMNCITWQAAQQLCRFDGRELVSEAQWEYAASGRGHENLYVWGDDAPTCERAAYARFASGGPATPGSYTECRKFGDGPARVGSFMGPGQDVTRDGIADLNANLREWVLDEIETYDRGCWAQPFLRDPVCVGLYPGLHTQRGASWGGGTGQLGLAWRDGRSDDQWRELGPFIGFRCARPARP